MQKILKGTPGRFLTRTRAAYPQSLLSPNRESKALWPHLLCMHCGNRPAPAPRPQRDTSNAPMPRLIPLECPNNPRISDRPTDPRFAERRPIGEQRPDRDGRGLPESHHSRNRANSYEADSRSTGHTSRYSSNTTVLHHQDDTGDKWIIPVFYVIKASQQCIKGEVVLPHVLFSMFWDPTMYKGRR